MHPDISDAAISLTTVKGIIHRYAIARWRDKELLEILQAFIADTCDPAHLENYLRTVVQVENEVKGSVQQEPAFCQQKSFLDSEYSAGLQKYLEHVANFRVQAEHDNITITANVASESYRQVCSWLSMESPVPGIDTDAGVIFGYLIDIGDFQVYAVVLNSPYGPWLDAWIQTAENGMEPSPPPIGSLDTPIVFNRPAGTVTLEINELI